MRPADLPRILLVEHARFRRGFYQVVLDWIAERLPACAGLFDLRVLDPGLRPQEHHTLLVPWLQDPVQSWSQEAYDQAEALQAHCDARGIAVINRVEHLTRAGKALGASLMAAAGLRTPRSVRILDRRAFHRDALGLRFPLFVREDWGHGGEMLRIDDLAGARAAPLERLQWPVAVELIDLADPGDGLYRKFRYVVAGGRGVPHHLQASRDWVTRGENREASDRTRADELAYIEAPCPHHDLFLAASRQLGLDFVAFDYGLDPAGQPVVWEANPFPFIQFSKASLVYRNDALHRTLAILVALYFERAGVALPAWLHDFIAAAPAIRASAG
jgi:hypothetical protein